jgi:hypothetical protein
MEYQSSRQREGEHQMGSDFGAVLYMLPMKILGLVPNPIAIWARVVLMRMWQTQRAILERLSAVEQLLLRQPR